MKKLKSTVSMLLVLVLLLGMLYVPQVSAEELSTDTVYIDQILYQESAAEERNHETEDETVHPVEIPTSETEVREPVPDEQVGSDETPTDETPEETPGLLTNARAITEGRYLNTANIWPMNGEVLTYTYQGKKHTMDHMPLHAIYYNGAYRTAYCIEPGKIVDGSNVYTGEEVTGESPWGKMDYSKQRGVSLALLYGAPNSISSTDERTDIAYQMATYMIIHEIILGFRESVHPFNRTNDAYFDVFGGGTASNEETLGITSDWYTEAHWYAVRRTDIAYAYNYISDKLAKHDLVPSFASSFQNQAKTYELVDQGNGTYSITLTDTNGILSQYSFTNTADLTFTKSSDGKSLTITTKNPLLETTMVAPTKVVPNVSENGSAFLIWSLGSEDQSLCTVKSMTEDPVPAYFKVRTPQPSLSIQKVIDEDGPLNGWEFALYSDAACTKLVSGPHTTGRTGVITLDGVAPGEYYVKELGHIDNYVNAEYGCTGENPKKVTLEKGKTTTVTFENVLRNGSLKIVKSTNTGTNLEGWRFDIYSDAACLNPIEGSPFYTNAGGTVIIPDLPAGTIYVKEDARTDPLWECDSDVHAVVISANKTKTLNIRNIQYGTMKIIKKMLDGGSVEGWTFDIHQVSDNALVGTYTTGADGTIVTDKLLPGSYYVYERLPEDSEYINETPNPQVVSVTGGATAEVIFNNCLASLSLAIEKVDEQGNALTGAEFLLEWSEDGQNWAPIVSSAASGVKKGTTKLQGVENGKIKVDDAGKLLFDGLHSKCYYRLTETAAPEGYQLLKEAAFEGVIEPDEDRSLAIRIVNAPAFLLPATGAQSMIAFAVVQASLMIAGTIFIVEAKKRKEIE